MIETTQAVRDAILDGQVPELFVEIAFSSITLYLTTAGTDIDWNGATWLANGFITDEPENNQERELRTTSDALNLTGVDLTVAAVILNESQQGRRVTVREVFLDDQGQVIPDPYVRDVYFIDQWGIEQGPESAEVSLTLAGEFSDFDFKNGIRTTDASLQRVHPGDRLMRYASTVQRDQQWEGR